MPKQLQDKPRANHAFMAQIVPRRWTYETSDDATRFVLMPGYFDAMVKTLRVEDEISVIGLADEPARHMLLCVDSIEHTAQDKVSVVVMHEFKRSA